MFTGIIEELGKITRINPAASGVKLTIEADLILDDVKLGDSIAINGACQTVVSFDDKSFSVEVSAETLEVTTFKTFKEGQVVNLERALRLCDRLGGHLVNGHVDSTGELIEIKTEGISKVYTFRAPVEVSKYLVYKGSVCINGISLTVSELKDNDSVFSVAVIPHTFKNTTLLELKPGDQVNLEADILAKYTEKLLKNQGCNSANESNITYDFLLEHGFA